VIIDGYNLILRSGRFSPLDRTALELGRDALVEKLSAYKKIKRHKITVVFDGSQKFYFQGPAFSQKGIGLRFSRHGETADEVICAMAKKERQRAVVVSSDNEVCRRAETFGAATMGTQTFEERMEMALGAEISGDDENDDSPWSGNTVKKGPSRRPPKKARQHLQKTGKL